MSSLSSDSCPTGRRARSPCFAARSPEAGGGEELPRGTPPGRGGARFHTQEAWLLGPVPNLSLTLSQPARCHCCRRQHPLSHPAARQPACLDLGGAERPGIETEQQSPDMRTALAAHFHGWRYSEQFLEVSVSGESLLIFFSWLTIRKDIMEDNQK